MDSALNIFNSIKDINKNIVVIGAMVIIALKACTQGTSYYVGQSIHDKLFMINKEVIKKRKIKKVVIIKKMQQMLLYHIWMIQILNKYIYICCLFFFHAFFFFFFFFFI